MNKIDNFDFYKDYFDEIIEPRNELGHCEETEINGEKALSTRKGLRKFTHQDCIEIRKKIIIHHQRLEIIEKFILNL